MKNNYDINIIFSYFKILPQKYLKKSKINLVPHESDLPNGRDVTFMAKQKVRKNYLLFNRGWLKVDAGLIYKSEIYQKVVDEIKKIQFNENLKLIKFIKFYKIRNRAPKLKSVEKSFKVVAKRQ